MKRSIKETVFKIAKYVGGTVCVLVGLTIGGFGIAQFIPEQKYAELPKRDDHVEDN